MTNRLVLIVLAATTILLGACNPTIDVSFEGEVIDGSGTITTETYKLSGIDRIEICCSLDVEVEVIADGSDTVEIETDSNLQSVLKLSLVDGGTLSIEPDERSTHLNSTGPIVVRISDPLITAVRVRAASSLTGTFPEVDEFSVRADAGSKVNASIEADRVDVISTSASDVTLVGRGDQLTVSANSAASADLSQLEAINTKVDATSAATVKINTTSSITGEANSSAEIEVRGGPGTFKMETSNGASVEYLP